MKFKLFTQFTICKFSVNFINQVDELTKIVNCVLKLLAIRTFDISKFFLDPFNLKL